MPSPRSHEDLSQTESARHEAGEPLSGDYRSSHQSLAEASHYEHELYVAGMLGGRKPARPLDWRELERDAYAMLSRGPRGYIQGGAGLGETIRANREAFDEWRIVPRMLRDVSQRELATSVLGMPMPAPLMLAPVGVQLPL